MATMETVLYFAPKEISGGRYLEVPDLAALESGTFTIEIWIRPTKADVNIFEIRRYSNGNTTRVLIISIASLLSVPTLNLLCNNSWWYGSTITLEQWHHLALVVENNGQTIHLYLDGKLSLSKTATLNFSSRAHVILGSRETNFSVGYLAEFRVWSRARTADEIDANKATRAVPGTADLAVYLPLNVIDPNYDYRSVALTAVDVTDSGLFQGSSGASSEATSTTGATATVLHFSPLGSVGSRSVQVPPTVMKSGTFTIELWYRPTRLSGNIFSALNRLTGKILAVGVKNEAWELCVDFNTNPPRFQAVPKLNQWHHLAIVVENGSTAKLYANGEFIMDVTRSMSVSEAHTFSFGDGRSFAGDMAEIRIWSTARTAEEIAANWVTRVRPGTANLVQYLPLDAFTDDLAYTNVEFKSIDVSDSGLALSQTPAELTTIINRLLVKQLEQSTQTKTLTSTTVSEKALYFSPAVSATQNAKIGSFGVDINGNLTVEFWFKAPSSTPSTDKYLLHVGGTSSASMQVTLGKDQKLTWTLTEGTPTTILGTLVLEEKRWYHIALVIESGTKCTLYINGNSQNTATRSTKLVWATDAAITLGNQSGATTNDAAIMGGYLSELRLWKAARTQSQIQALMVTRANVNEANLTLYALTGDASQVTVTGAQYAAVDMSELRSATAMLARLGSDASDRRIATSNALSLLGQPTTTKTLPNLISEDVKTKLDGLTNQVNTLTSDKSTLTGQVNTLTSEKSDLQTTISTAKKKAQDLLALPSSDKSLTDLLTDLDANTTTAKTNVLKLLKESTSTDPLPTLVNTLVTNVDDARNQVAPLLDPGSDTKALANFLKEDVKNKIDGLNGTISSATTNALSLFGESSTTKTLPNYIKEDVKTKIDGLTNQVNTLTSDKSTLTGQVNTLTGTTVSENALYFDSAVTTLQSANIGSFSVDTNGNVTVEFWFRAPSTTSGQNRYLLDVRGTSSTRMELKLGISQKLFWMFKEDNRISYIWGTSVLEEKRWYHIALVIESGTKCTLYLNGNSQNTATRSTKLVWATDAAITLGNRPQPLANDQAMLDGYFSELRLWKAARTQSQIQALMATRASGNESALTLYPLTGDTSQVTVTGAKYAAVDMSELRSATAMLSRLGNVISDNKQLTSGSVHEYALYFSSAVTATQSAKIGSFSVDTNGNVTVEFWFRTPSSTPSTDKYLLDVRGTSSASMQVTLGKDQKLTWTLTEGTPTTILGTLVLEEKRWYHIALVIESGTKCTLYLNGNSQNTATRSTKLVWATDAAITLGNQSGATTNDAAIVGGYVSELRLWKAARTQSQIQALMATRASGNEPNLTLYALRDDASQVTVAGAQYAEVNMSELRSATAMLSRLGSDASERRVATSTVVSLLGIPTSTDTLPMLVNTLNTKLGAAKTTLATLSGVTASDTDTVPTLVETLKTNLDAAKTKLVPLLNLPTSTDPLPTLVNTLVTNVDDARKQVAPLLDPGSDTKALANFLKEDVKNKIDTLNTDKSNLTSEKSKLQADLTAANTAKTNLEKEKQNLQSQLETATAERDALKKQIPLLEKERDDAKTTSASKDQNLTQKELQITKLNNDISLLTEKLTIADRSVQEVEKQLAIIREKEQHITDLNSKIAGMENAEGQTSLEDFVKNANKEITRARATLVNQGSKYGLGRVSLEIKMVPGPGGMGMKFPTLDDMKKLGATQLSTLAVDFEAQETNDNKVSGVVVPMILGYTEVMARRKIVEAGFLVEISYQAVKEVPGRTIEADRVVNQIPKAGENAPLGSYVTIFIGRKS